MTDKWLYCLYCPLNRHCENQTRGIECATGLKVLVQNFHILEKKLEIATKALKKLTRHCDQWEIAREALKEMEELK